MSMITRAVVFRSYVVLERSVSKLALKYVDEFPVAPPFFAEGIVCIMVWSNTSEPVLEKVGLQPWIARLV